jgi:hypothetical protein
MVQAGGRMIGGNPPEAIAALLPEDFLTGLYIVGGMPAPPTGNRT